MAQDPIITLIHLNSRILMMDRIQSFINRARVDYQGNQYVQLELDRQQNDLDDKRALIEMTMADIRSRN